MIDTHNSFPRQTPNIWTPLYDIYCIFINLFILHICYIHPYSRNEIIGMQIRTFISFDLLIAWQSICLAIRWKTKLLNVRAFYAFINICCSGSIWSYIYLYDNVNLPQFVSSQMLHYFLKIICNLWYANILTKYKS